MRTCKHCFLLIALFCSLSALAQQGDSEKPTKDSTYGIFDLNFESGVFFVKNSHLQTAYNVRTNYNWSLGIKFGASDWRFLPWFKYASYKSSVDTAKLNSRLEDHRVSMQRKQLAVGLVNPIQLSDKHYLQFKGGVSFNGFSDEWTGLISSNWGMTFSVGYMQRISRYVSYYVDLNYDYAQTRPEELHRDWSGFLVNAGISLNIGAE